MPEASIDEYSLALRNKTYIGAASNVSSMKPVTGISK
jgi:hypothetical protein